MGEDIIKECSRAYNLSSILLRYFNPVGAHPSALIGELPLGKNLKKPCSCHYPKHVLVNCLKMIVHGNDYDTRDGSCLRDYIHVCDIAHAHTLALQYLMDKKNQALCEIFNLGSGNGVTVLEAIKAFEKATGQKLNYKIGPRRPGDVVAIYANNNRAVKSLNWHIQYSLEDMMKTAWNWELKVKQEEELLKQQNPMLN